MLERLRGDGFRMVTIIDPGVKFEPGYAVFDEAVKRDVLCKTEAGAIYLGQVWPGKTAFPDFVTPEARRWWGELNAAHVRSGLAGIWNDMNEPATGEIPCGAMRFGNGEFPTSVTTTSTACSWRWARSRGCSKPGRTSGPSCSRARGPRASSVMPPTGSAIIVRVGNTCG